MISADSPQLDNCLAAGDFGERTTVLPHGARRSAERRAELRLNANQAGDHSDIGPLRLNMQSDHQLQDVAQSFDPGKWL